MDLLLRRVGERFADVLEWIDYRRDANFWPFFGLPPLLSVAWAYGGWIGVGLIVAFAAAFALFVAVATAFAVGGWILCNALLDVVVPMFAARGQTTYPTAASSATVR